MSVDTLERHEIVFCEKMKTAGHTFEWIPRDDSSQHQPTNDFTWTSHSGTTVSAELKSLSSTKYSTAAHRISDAVGKAQKRGVEKNIFILDFGDSQLSVKEINQLGLYNKRNPEKQIKEPWTWSSNGLEQIELK